MATFIKTTRPDIPFFYNVTARVGQNCPNNPDDVALATYLMRLSAKAATNPQARQICLNTSVTNSCGASLVKSIIDLQTALSLTLDGRISPTTPTGDYGKSAFLIARFNFLVKTGFRDYWPRIDKIPDANTPPEVANLVIRSLVGS